MAIKLTLDIYSGRENPTITLKGKEANDLMKRLQPAEAITRGQPKGLPTPTLGYRGIIVEQTGKAAAGLPRAFRQIGGDVIGDKLAHRAEDASVESYMLRDSDLIERFDLTKKEIAAVRRDARAMPERRALLLDKVKPIKLKFPAACNCAPLYEPNWWNVPSRQPHNNCYNYSTNYRTDTFAQPGRAAGAMYTSLTCSEVKRGAVADDLIDSPKANNRCPKEGHLVALVVGNGIDYHWYRKGRNGLWTHKPGGTAVTNLDNSGKIITDPRTADRGIYTSFCTFMVVMHGHIKIS